MNEIFTIPVRRCKQCGRLLVSEDSIKRGYGCWCAKKAKQEEQARKPVDGQINLLDFLAERECE